MSEVFFFFLIYVELKKDLKKSPDPSFSKTLSPFFVGTYNLVT